MTPDNDSLSDHLSSTFNSNKGDTEDILANYSKVVLSDDHDDSIELLGIKNDMFGEDVTADEFLDKLVKLTQLTCQKLVEKDKELLEASEKCVAKDNELLELKEVVVLQEKVTKQEKQKYSEMQERYSLIEAEVDRIRNENVQLKKELKQTRQDEIHKELKQLKQELCDFKNTVKDDITSLQNRIPQNKTEQNIASNNSNPNKRNIPQNNNNNNNKNNSNFNDNSNRNNNRNGNKNSYKNHKKAAGTMKGQEDEKQKQKQEHNLDDMIKQLRAQSLLPQYPVDKKDDPLKPTTTSTTTAEKQKQQKDEEKNRTQNKREEQKNIVDGLLNQLVAVLQIPSDSNTPTATTESTAPWVKNNSDFVENYMKNAGYTPGKGLGKNGDGIKSPIKANKTSFKQYKENLIFYVGTSMIGGVKQKQNILCQSTNERVKVHSHSGATIEDIKDHLRPHLRKKPTHLILQVGTNDAQNRDVTSDKIYEDLIDLKNYCETTVPGIQVFISCPIVRTDNKWANAKLRWVKNRILREGLTTITNDNITVKHLSSKGLHLNQSGTDILLENVRDFILTNIKNK
jgi:hypothetical protein